MIRLDFPLAFQRRIANYSTAKTREATAKTRHKVENDGVGFSSWFGFAQTYFAISRAVGVRF